ncbi:MAG: hypothetical protein GYA24_03760 [Candidatus Lokiarchaeota archaeon]|nr:hypothetical protein [Candidatus Lokiarchaeota archaeon]
MVGKIRNKKEKKNDFRYPRAVRVVTLLMVLVGIATAGVATYVTVSGTYLGMNIGDTLGSVMGGIGGGGGSNGTGPFNQYLTNTSVRMYLAIPVNNSAVVGLDINDLAVDVSFTLDNGTSLRTTSLIGSIPFGETRLANITILDTTPSLAMALNGTSLTFAISFSMKIALPRSWGIFALTISDLEFGFTMPMPGGLSF